MPRFETFTGGDPLVFVLSPNHYRRHLDESRRSMVVDKLANMALGANQHIRRRSANLPTGAVSQHDAAAMLNVSPRSLQLANLHRRHRDESQRCMVAEKLANTAVGEKQHTQAASPGRCFAHA